MDTSCWASVVRMPAPNIFDTAVQMNKTWPIKHENKRNVWSCLIECLMAFKFYQTRPNTIKHDQTSPNKVAKQWNVWSPNNVWWCLVAKHFPFGQAFRLIISRAHVGYKVINSKQGTSHKADFVIIIFYPIRANGIILFHWILQSTVEFIIFWYSSVLSK